MTQFYLTTTGNTANVTLPDLGGVTLVHPLTDVPLISPDGQFTISDIEKSFDGGSLSDSILGGDITIKDSIGTVITTTDDISNYTINKSYYDYAERTTVVETTASEHVYLTKTLNIPANGLYRVTYTAIVHASKNKKKLKFYIALGGVYISNPDGDGWIISEISNNMSDIPISGTRTLQLAAGNHDMVITIGALQQTITARYANFDIERII